VRDFSYILTIVPGFILGLTLHEFSHAWVAYRLGDTTAQRMGRLTLNPLAHLDLFGSLMLVFAGFGWAKPVPVDSSQMRYPRRDMAFVALAGPVSNLLLAIAIALCLKILLMVGLKDMLFQNETILIVIARAVWINVVLAVFNLIPLPPLDGSRILAGIVPEEWNHGYEQMERYGPILLLGLVMLASFTGVSILSRIIMPVADPIYKLIMGMWLLG
jgi:Zn-dependent protease